MKKRSQRRCNLLQWSILHNIGSISEMPTIARIQRTRVKGSRAPGGTLYCGRPSRYQNPHVIGPGMCRQEALCRFKIDFWSGKLEVTPYSVREDLSHSAWRHLSCWCKLDEACHVDEYVLALTCHRCLRQHYGEPHGNCEFLPFEKTSGGRRLVHAKLAS